MLRTMKGYDEYNTILLPPRKPGDKLPQEVTDAYNEQQRKKEAEEKEKAEAAAAAQGERVAEEAGEGAVPTVIATVPPSTRGEGAKAEFQYPGNFLTIRLPFHVEKVQAVVVRSTCGSLSGNCHK